MFVGCANSTQTASFGPSAYAAPQVYEGRVVEGDPGVCGHVISTTASGGGSQQSINYSTERVVGNGSFGVVFQATCLETGETVSTLTISFHAC